MPQNLSQPLIAADYIIVMSSDDDIHNGFHLFAEKVNRKLKAGYQLVGPPFNINQFLCQAMLRPEGLPSMTPPPPLFKGPEELRML